MRRLAAALALVSIAATPAIGQTRFYCRFTGAEIVGCAGQRIAERSTVDPQDCCEQRTTRSLEPARASVADPSVAPAAPLAIAVAAPPLARKHRGERPARVQPGASGPPLYLEQRALLI